MKDILVHSDGGAGSSSRLEYAVQLARQHDARLLVVHAQPSPVYGYGAGQVPPYGFFYNYAIPQLTDADVQRYQTLEQDSAEQAQRDFNRYTDQTGVAAELRVVSGPAVLALAQLAPYADLVLVGQDDPVLAADLVFSLGRPLLVLPPHSGIFGQHLLVAWNGSREASRAVHDALPLLQRAQRVTVLTIATARAPEAEPAAAQLSAHLVRHGVAAVADALPETDQDTSAALLARAAELKADGLVMGAYGHSRLREWVMGGATRDVLRQATLPVLLSH